MRNEIGYLLATLWFVGFVIVCIMLDEMKDEAVSRGHAVYCTTSDGTEFRWIDEECP